MLPRELGEKRFLCERQRTEKQIWKEKPDEFFFDETGEREAPGAFCRVEKKISRYEDEQGHVETVDNASQGIHEEHKRIVFESQVCVGVSENDEKYAEGRKSDDVVESIAVRHKGLPERRQAVMAQL